MLTPSIIRTQLELTIGKSLQDEGFYSDHTDSLQYKKDFPGGFSSLLFSIVNNDESLWVELSFGVRIDLVENLANQYGLTLENYYPDTHTILTSYGRMIGDKFFRFKINLKEPKQLSSVTQTMNDFLKEKALPFLEEKQSIYEIDKLINTSPEKPSNFIYNQSHRCLKGIIIARFTQNPHFITLTKAYHFILSKQSFGDQILPNYEKLVKYLSATSFN